jgi:putative copper export protein
MVCGRIAKPGTSVEGHGDEPFVSCAKLRGVKRLPNRTRAAAVAICAALSASLAYAPAALADNGVGLAGPTTDKTVTFFCFGVIAFFALLVIVMTLVQEGLERRKEMRRSDFERLR